VLALRQLERQEYLGGAAIVARHLAALGASAVLISSASDRDAGAVQALLTGENVEFHALPRRAPIVEKERYLVEESKVLAVERGACAPLDSHAEKQAAAIIAEQVGALDALIVCDYGYGMITAGLLERILPAARKRIPVIAGDVNGARGSLLNFKDVDLLCPSERELRDTLHDFEEGLSSAAYRLLDRTQARHMLCTLGRRGLVVFQRQTQDRTSPEWGERLLSEHFPALGGAGVDRLGCGDALLAASTLGLAGGASLMQAAYLGSAAAAIESDLIGNRPIDVAMLEHWLATREELSDSNPDDPAASPFEPSESHAHAHESARTI
jgi:bifunctional ADP-heptose synthase (sugar kinase/adenylyltransferase)